MFFCVFFCSFLEKSWRMLEGFLQKVGKCDVVCFSKCGLLGVENLWWRMVVRKWGNLVGFCWKFGGFEKYRPTGQTSQ